MIDLVDRIQTYLRQDYEDRKVVDAAPFHVCLGGGESKPDSSVAVPCQRTIESDDDLLHMEDAFWQHRQSPRIQFLDRYSPTLTALLGQNGYELIGEEMVLACTADSIRPAPKMPGLTTLVLSGDSSLADVKDGLQQTSQLGFNPFATRMLDTDAEMFRKTLVTGQAFVLRLDKNPVAAGMFKEIHDGLTQAVGLTTLENYRRQGFAAYLTGYMTKYAFSRHVDTVFLTTSVDGTENVYRRVGFNPCATLLTFKKEL